MDITKRNYKKILRELDLSEYPSLDEYLINIKKKLVAKTLLSVSEELMTFPRLKKYFEEYKKAENNYLVSQIDFSQFNHRPPKDFQIEGIKFLLLNDKCILADSMGVGKSIQSIIAALLLPENYKILIITLKTLKYNFEEEIKYYSDSYKVIEKEWESGYKFTIVHYEAVKKWKEKILKEKFDCIIIDESHKVKSPKSLRTKNVFAISKNVKKIWLLTGTPMANRPIDYFNLLKLINHPITNNWRKYVETYCDGYERFGHWEVKGASNLESLYKATKSSVLRRLKTEVLKDLPNKERMPIYLHLKDRKEYNEVIQTYKESKFENSDLSEFCDIENFDIAMMTKFILWRQYCALKKIEDGSLKELIENQIEEGNKVVVFTNFTKVIDALIDSFKDDCRFIDGRVTDAKKRLQIINEYNEDDNLKLLVLNLQVGSVGLNIQSANIAIINDMDWVPPNMLQAEDRLWRMGQKKNVNILYPIYKDTVEEIVFNLVNKKMKNISMAIEGKEEEYFETLDNSFSENPMKDEKKSILEEIFSQLG